MRSVVLPLVALIWSTTALAQPLPPPLPPTHGMERAPTYTYTARTNAVARRLGAVNALGVHWTCTRRECTVAGSWREPIVAGCIALARQVGQISYFGRDGAILDTQQLARCNAAALPQPHPEASPTLVFETSPLVLTGAEREAPSSVPPETITTNSLVLVGGSSVSLPDSAPVQIPSLTVVGN